MARQNTPRISTGFSLFLIPVTCRRTAISTAVTLACTPPMLYAAEWENNVELFLSGGTDRSMFGAQALIPLRQDADSMWYADIRGIAHRHSTKEVNIGGGYRTFTEDSDWILGGYLSYDSRTSSTDTHWDQLTIGAEALGDIWDVRGNLYHSLDDKKRMGVAPTGARFSGFKLIRDSVYEEAMSGFDVEVGRLLPLTTNHELRAYLGGYHYDGDIVKDADGISARLEWRPRKNIIVNLAAQDDNLFGSEARLEFRLSFGYPHKKGRRSLRERMIQFAQRDIDVKDTSELPYKDRVVNDGLAPGGTIENMVHIDNTAAASGDGSAEKPFASFNECRTAAGTQGCSAGKSTEYIFVHTGTSVSGTAYATDGVSNTQFDLQNSVGLIGEGAAIFGLPAGTAPELTASAGRDVVNMLGNNEVAGLAFNADGGTSGNGLYAYNTSTGSFGFNIHDNQFNGLNRGIDILNIAYGPGTTITQGVTISSNTFNNSTSNAIRLVNYAGGYATATQTTTLSNNTIKGSGNDGVYLNNIGVYGGKATQNATLNNNTITNNSANGIQVSNVAYYGGTSSQNVAISNNTINGNTNNGIFLYNATYYGNATQDVNLDNNTITGNNGSGLFNVNYEYYNSGYKTTQTVDLTGGGNTITGNTNGDVYNVNYEYYGAATQTVDMTGGNSIGSVNSYNNGYGTQIIKGP